MKKRLLCLICLAALLLSGCRGTTTISREDQLDLKNSEAVTSGDTQKDAETVLIPGTTAPETSAAVTEPSTAPSTEPSTAPTAAPTTAPTTAPITSPSQTAEPEGTTVPETTQFEPNVYDISGYTVGDLETRILALLNDYRTQNGLNPLDMDLKLAAVAAVRAYECSLSFSHTRPDGRDCFSALDDYGYSYWSAGENILMCSDIMSAEAMVDAWMSSEGHRANILSEAFTLAGIGVWSSGGMIYAANFFAG